MLVTSIFSFSHYVFYPSQEKLYFFNLHVFCRLLRLSIWSRTKILLFGKELTLYRTILTFNNPEREGNSKHCGERRNAGHQRILLFSQCFLPYQREKLSFQQHLFCRLQMLSIWTSLKFFRVVKS